MEIMNSIYEDDSAKILWTLNNSTLFNKLPKCVRKYIVKSNGPYYNIGLCGHKNILILGHGGCGKTVLVKNIMANLGNKYDCILYGDSDCHVNEILNNQPKFGKSVVKSNILLIVDDWHELLNQKTGLLRIIKHNKYYSVTTIVIRQNVDIRESLDLQFDCIIAFKCKGYNHKQILYDRYFNGLQDGIFNDEYDKLEQHQMLISDTNYNKLIKYKAGAFSNKHK